MTVLFVVFAVLALLALPYEPLNRLTPDTEAVFEFASKDSSVVGNLHVSGKGGISAGNPLTLDVTLNVSQTKLNFTLQKVLFVPDSAILYPIVTNALGFPTHPTLSMKKVSEVEWWGQLKVIYYQEGSYGADLILQGPLKSNPLLVIVNTGHLPFAIHVSSEDVTVTAKTNALLLSLSLAFLAFSCLELRVEENRSSCNSTQSDNDLRRGKSQ